MSTWSRLKASFVWSLKYLLRKQRVRFALFWVLFTIVLAAVGPLITPYDPTQTAGPPRQPPCSKYWLGTDWFGFDLFTRVVYGLRVSLYVGVIAAIVGTTVGVLLGLVSGYFGGLVDEIVSFVVNLLLTIPPLLIVILVLTYIGFRGLEFNGLLIGLLQWHWVARAVRSITKSLRSRDFVLVSRMSGLSAFETILNDILPNMLSYVALVFVLQFSSAVFFSVTLEFFGLVPGNIMSIGFILQQAVLWNAIQMNVWWWAIIPGILITLFLGSLYVISSSLDELFNPRLRGE
ncbi:ABC transporter permease [Thermofilum pendens]|uniref:Binding-protein-dependent transport systems inner membrane component n=1 Tax=Thermofilum pendens (strain DSM 2475 / Hrk 5) TaxID=368408 RepID=A1S0U3_THEPD|nr:ABC transporter permease [Thermofilum pendens]ABL79073.1 binding-protein-dependent transport systems inner membrane component [Thermofilum pendens Hrk 5]